MAPLRRPNALLEGASACALCASPASQRTILNTARLELKLCEKCVHFTAMHTGSGIHPKFDYHAGYAATYLASLETTRRRQARRWLEKAREILGESPRVLDVGAGQGWFVDEAKNLGIEHLSAVDPSKLAVDKIQSRGIAAYPFTISDVASMQRAFPRRELRPNTLVLLDVVEHLESSSLRPALSTWIEWLQPELKLVVIKVPNARGLLHRLAMAAVGARKTQLLESLYQVGTYPPHFQGFTGPSLANLATSVGLKVDTMLRDVDFESESFGARLQIQPAWKRIFCAGVALGLSLTARLTHLEDSLIVFAKVAQSTRD